MMQMNNNNLNIGDEVNVTICNRAYRAFILSKFNDYDYTIVYFNKKFAIVDNFKLCDLIIIN